MKGRDMPSSTVTSKGQTTIPKEIRERLHLNPGDRVDFVVTPDGRVVLEPATGDFRELKGMLHRKGERPVSISEMREAIRERFRPR